jgi:hypothetical protein
VHGHCHGGGEVALGQERRRSWQTRGRPEEGRLGRRSSWGRRVEMKHSRRWRGAAENGGRRRSSRGAEEQRRCQRKKKREGGPKDFFGICKNLRDLTVN